MLMTNIRAYSILSLAAKRRASSTLRSINRTAKTATITTANRYKRIQTAVTAILQAARIKEVFTYLPLRRSLLRSRLSRNVLCSTMHPKQIKAVGNDNRTQAARKTTIRSLPQFSPNSPGRINFKGFTWRSIL